MCVLGSYRDWRRANEPAVRDAEPCSRRLVKRSDSDVWFGCSS